jgi:hypothetical protein
MERSCYRQELVSRGYKGALLRVLEEIIVDADTMQEFSNYIILKGEAMKPLLLVHKFKQHMQDKQSFQSGNEFDEAYTQASTLKEKYDVILKMLASKATIEQLNKVLDIIDSELLSVSEFYDIVGKYRKMYTTSEIIILIESMHIVR